MLLYFDDLLARIRESVNGGFVLGGSRFESRDRGDAR
jgi:hypothetical protein